MELRLSNAFSGSKEMKDPAPQLSGRAALEAAKRKLVHQQASLKSEIICSSGEGRATREFKLIWSPIYDCELMSALYLQYSLYFLSFLLPF